MTLITHSYCLNVKRGNLKFWLFRNLHRTSRTFNLDNIFHRSVQPQNRDFKPEIRVRVYSHRIGGNHERRVVNNFSFSIAKINVFDCQNRYNGNRKRLISVRQLPFWQSKTLYLTIVNDFSEDERSFASAAYPV